MDGMPLPRPPHLHHERSRHGALVWYVRRGKGPRVRLREAFGTPAFWTEYRAAIEGAPVAKAGVRPQSLAWLIGRYRASSAWAELAPATRRQRENIYRHVIATSGIAPIPQITPEVITEGRESRAATPHAANNFLKAMRGLFGWAVAQKPPLAGFDPTLGIKLLKGPNDDIGFHPWTEEEVARFEAHWPVGTRERLALDVLLYTGFRRGDAVRFGRQHVRDGLITIRTEKTGEEVCMPLLPVLSASIAATTTGDLAFLVTASGMPWVKESFGNWFRETCKAAKVPGAAHGLRKIGATRAAENGATERQLMAIFGWSTGVMAVKYTRSAEKKRLARDAGRMLIPARSENVTDPHLGSTVPAPPTNRLTKKVLSK